MTVTSGFFEAVGGDRAYNAEDHNTMFDGIITEGVIESWGGTLMVSASTGMEVLVDTGRAWFNKSWLLNDTQSPYAIPAAHPTLDRIDIVALDFNKDSATRNNDIVVIAGTPAVTPVPPTLISGGQQLQKPLAEVYVSAGVTGIVAGNITNKVGTSSCPFAFGALRTVTVDTLLAQWYGLFWDWFQSVQDLLSTTPIGSLQEEVDELYIRENVGRNIFMNGSMRIYQRGISQSGITTLYGYPTCADRIIMNIADAGTWRVEIETYASEPWYNVEVTSVGGTGDTKRLYIGQRIENCFLHNVMKGTSKAKYLVLSFDVRTNVAGVHIIQMFDAKNNRSFSASYELIGDGSVEHIELKIPPDLGGSKLTWTETDTSAYMALRFWLAAGTNWTTGVLPGAWEPYTQVNVAPGQVNTGALVGNYFALKNVQLEIGEVASSFEQLSYQRDLEICQRYYQKESHVGIGHVLDTNQLTMDIPFQTPLRTDPNNPGLVSITFGGSYTIFPVTNLTGVAVKTLKGLPVNAWDRHKFQVVGTGTGLTLYQSYQARLSDYIVECEI